MTFMRAKTKLKWGNAPADQNTISGLDGVQGVAGPTESTILRAKRRPMVAHHVEMHAFRIYRVTADGTRNGTGRFRNRLLEYKLTFMMSFGPSVAIPFPGFRGFSRLGPQPALF